MTSARRSRTGRPCRSRRARSSRTSRRTRRRCPRRRSAEGKALLEWLADEHFTFLGYREYQLEQVVEVRDGARQEDVLRPVPGSGLGILRDGSADDHKSSSFGRLSGAVKAKAREKSLLVLAKANSRATVHRPAYLDYVGVKVFGADGEVVGERRFLGLFSSAAYTESVLRVPLLRVKVADVLEATGLDPRSHDGNALLDTLETYPRDELFHTPTDELAPIAEAAMQARERRAVRLFIRRDIYDRYLSVLIYLPRDRYNTSVRQKFVRILAQVIGDGRIDPDSIEFNVSISESTTARVHFVVRMPVGETIPDSIDTADLERRLIDASRSWHDDFLQRRLDGVRRGGRRDPGAAATSTRSPRPTRRTSRPGPRPSTSAGSRRSRATPGSTRRSTPSSTRRRARRG